MKKNDALEIIGYGTVAKTSVSNMQVSSIKGRFHKLICALRPAICTLRPTFEKLFIGAKVWRKAKKIAVGDKIVNEIDPTAQFYKSWVHGVKFYFQLLHLGSIS